MSGKSHRVSLINTFGLFAVVIVMFLTAAAGAQLAALGPDAFRDVLEPDFRRRDLALVAESLQLRDDQRVVVEALLDDYTSEFDAGVKALREKVANWRPASSGASAREAHASFRKDVDAMRAETQRLVEAAGSDEERQALLEAYEKRVHARRDQMVAERQGNGDSASGLASRDALLQEIADAFKGWDATKVEMAARMQTSIQALLDDEQAPRWGALEQRLRRDKTLHRGVLSGERVDLHDIVDRLGLDDEVRRGLDPALEAYAFDLDQSLRTRNELVRSTRSARHDALRAGDVETVRSIAQRVLARSVAVRDVNERHLWLIAGGLPEADAARFVEAFNAKAFARVFTRRRGERMLQQAAQRTDLSTDARMKLLGVEEHLVAEMDYRNEALRTLIRRWEPALKEHEAAAAAAARANEPIEPMVDPIQEAFAARREVELGIIAEIGAITGEAGPSPQADGHQLPRDRNGDPEDLESVKAAQQRIRERFDADGDGRLSPEEREAAAAHVAEHGLFGEE